MDTPKIPVVYGIKNCSTVQKARAWLEAAGVAYTFHDYKKEGVPADRLAAWTDKLGWEKLLNRQGTTWRKLPEDEKAQVVDAASAQRIMQQQPSLIKRPLLEAEGEYLLGFDTDRYAACLGKRA